MNTTNNKFINPLLDFHYEYSRNHFSYYLDNPDESRKLTEKYLDIFQITNTNYTLDDIYEEIESLTDIPNRTQEQIKIMARYPETVMRHCIASGYLTKENCEAIKSFALGSVWDHGAGSGYNSFLLKQVGTTVYSTDIPDNSFDARYVTVYDSLKVSMVKEIADNNGAMFISWPHEFYDFDLWESLGGKKFITILTNRDCFVNEGKLVCPIFDKPNWKLVKTIEPPHPGGESDMIYFYTRIE